MEKKKLIQRDFQFEDVFTISEILHKMDINADIETITKQIQTSKLENKNDAMGLGKELVVGLGIDLIGKVLKNLFKAKNEVKKLIMDLTGKSKKEVTEMKICEIKEFFGEIFKMEDFGELLKQAGEIEQS